MYIYKHVEVHILSSNTKNQCRLHLNPVYIFQGKIKIWETKSVCQAGNPLGKKPRELILQRFIHCFFLLWKRWMRNWGAASPKPCPKSASTCQGCGGKSPSTLIQTLRLQSAFLQLLGERCGDPGTAVISVGWILFASCMKKSSDGKTWRPAAIPEVLNVHGYLLMCFHWRI